MFGMTEDMSEEDARKLDEINAGEGKNLTSAQKAVVLRFGTIDIKAKKPKDSMSVDIPAGPKVKPKARPNPVQPIDVDDSSVKVKGME